MIRARVIAFYHIYPDCDRDPNPDRDRNPNHDRDRDRDCDGDPNHDRDPDHDPKLATPHNGLRNVYRDRDRD